MNRLKACAWIVLLFAGLISSAHGAAAIQAGPLDIPVGEVLPTKEQFEAEIESIRQQSEAYDEEAARLEGRYDQARQAYDDASQALRGGGNEHRDARKAYGDAWDRVRQLLREGAGDDALAPALEEALAAKLKPKDAAGEQDADELRARFDETSRAQRSAYEFYSLARQNASDYARLLRSAQSALRRFDGEGVYESFAKETKRIQQKVASRQQYAERLVTRQAEREQEATHWEKRWAEMTSVQRSVEVQRVEVALEKLDEQAKAIKEQHGTKLAAARELFDQRDEVFSRTRELRTKRSELLQQVRKLLREQGEAAPEVKAAEQTLTEINAALEQKEQEANGYYEQWKAASDEAEVVYREWKIADKEVGFMRDRHREASRRVAADPDAPKTDPRQREIQAIREAWEQVTGKDVQWGANPFMGQPITSGGSITQDGPDLYFNYDGPGYHAQMQVKNDGRTLHVFDDDGKVLFDGPVNHITHLKDFSLELYYLWEFLYTRVNIR